ncbi:MAG: acyl carrier protein [Lachnospiraceae bacterium]|nr:acyl carrier protein [Lachnospiraceae bacterium]
MFEKIVQIMEDQLGVDTNGITEETTFREDLRIDSLDLYELVTALEDEYSIEIQPEELEELKSIGDVVEYLAAKGIE